MSARRRAVVAPLLLSLLLVACGELGLEDTVAQREQQQAVEEPPEPPEEPTDPQEPEPPEDTLPDGALADPVLCLSDDPDCPDLGADPGTMLCTATAQLGGATPPGDLLATLTFEGRPLVEGSIPAAEVAASDGEPLTLSFGLGGLQFPNGSYVCEFDLGGAAGFSIEDTYADGVDAALWQAWVCDRDDAIQLAPEVLVCSGNDDELPDGTATFTCSAGAVPDGQDIEFELDADLDDDGPQDTLSLSFGVTDLGTAAVNGTVDALAFGGTPGDPLPAGDYECRFRIGDEEIERAFRIG